MKFKGTLLNIDGHADSSGDIFTRTSKIEFPKEVKVTHEFSNEKILGTGKISRQGKRLTYEIDIYPELLPPEVVKQLTPAIGGSIKQRDGHKITKATINQIGLSISGNADPRIKKLGEQS
jgi:hypothetical protein